MVIREEPRAPGWQPRRTITVVLLMDWYACDQALGNLASYDSKGGPAGSYNQNSTTKFLRDPNGLINGFLLARQDDDGSFYLPKGMSVDVREPEDDRGDGHWEPVNPGTGCPQGSGSEGSGPICYPVTGAALNFPILSNPAFILGIDANGCWGLVPVNNNCNGPGSGGS